MTSCALACLSRTLRFVRRIRNGIRFCFCPGFHAVWPDENGHDRLPKNLAIQRERLCSDVLETQAHFLGMDFLEVLFVWVGTAAQDFSLVPKPDGSGIRNARAHA